MTATRRVKRNVVAGITVLLCGAWTLMAEQPNGATKEAKGNVPALAVPKDVSTVAIEKARVKAKLMHQIYASTLDVMHHHFFRTDRAVLPARALEDVFADIEEKENVKTNWISVNTKAMSVHHEPKTEFEKQAANAIAAGKGEFEMVEDGHYLRAGAIPLGSSCINCHTGFFAKTPKTPRFAGLVIRVPLTKE